MPIKKDQGGKRHAYIFSVRLFGKLNLLLNLYLVPYFVSYIGLAKPVRKPLPIGSLLLHIANICHSIAVRAIDSKGAIEWNMGGLKGP